MSMIVAIVLVFLIFAFVMVIALNPKSKACKINTNFDTSGLKVSFETNEKSTPSCQE